MGRAKILENLGEGRYRIGLDLNLSYARRQLAEAQAYLAAFAARYQAAQDAVTDARAALVTVNDDLSSYLSAAQAACEAAYQAERAAYQDYIDAVNSQPAPGVAAGLLATAEAAHDAFMGAFTDELAITATAADADYQAGVGLFLDEPAVLNAEAVKLSGLSALLTARDEYADDLITLEAYQAAQNAYDTLRGDWLTVIADNSGDPLVKHYKDIWEAARDAFDKARNDLGKLIGNGGGIPAELEALLKKQAETYAALRAAEKDLQSLTLIKAEKERFILELTQRLAPYTDEQGDPVLPPVNAWCVDYTDDMPVDATVGTIEIPGERYLSVRVRPGYESRETWNAEREGLLSPSWSMSPETNWFNWALHPGNARWNPNARLGVIQAIDSNAETCTVVLDPQSNSPATVAPEGAVMEVNSPIQYVIDENGVEQSVLPGPNVSVVEGVTILANVPIEYMECNSGAFAVGDHVMVQFTGQDWAAPKVVGFADNPKPCLIRGLMLLTLAGINQDGSAESLHLKKTPSLLGYEFKHQKYDNEAVAGNINWRSIDGKTVLSWNGPRGRYFPQASDGISYQSSNPLGVDSHRYYVMKNPDLIVQPDHDFVLSLYYTEDDRNRVYKNKRLYAQPPSPFDQHVLGAAEVTAQDDDGQTTWLIIVVSTITAQPGGLWYYQLTYGEPDPAQAISVYVKAMSTTAGASTEWVKIAENDMATVPGTIPTNKCAYFSGSGDRFALLVPRVKPSDRPTQFSSSEFGNAFEVMNDAIVRGALTFTVSAVSCELTVTEQEDVPITGTYFGSCSADGEDGYVLSESYNYEGINTAIVAIDFDGDVEKQLIATIRCSADGVSSTAEKGYRPLGFYYYLSGNESHRGSASFTLEDQDGQVICEYEDNETREVTASHVQPLGEFTYGMQSVNVSVNRSGRLPLYYDLRDGAALFIEHETTSNSTVSSDAGGTHVVADVVYTTWLTDGASIWGYHTQTSEEPTQERSYFVGVSYYDFGLNWGRGIDDSVTQLIDFNHASASDAANAINIPQGYELGPLFRNALWVRMWGSNAGDVLASIGAYLSVHSIALLPSWPGGVFVTLNNAKGAMIWDDYRTIPNEAYTIDQKWFLTDHNLEAIWQDHLSQHPTYEGSTEFIDSVYRVVGQV